MCNCTCDKCKQCCHNKHPADRFDEHAPLWDKAVGAVWVGFLIFSVALVADVIAYNSGLF